MKFLLNFLSKRTILAISLLIIYYLLVVLLHKEVSDVIVSLVKDTPRSVYQGIVLAAGLLVLALYIFLIIRSILIREWKRSIIFYLFFTVLFVVLAFEIIIIHNIEIIHFAQYAGLAILLFPIVKRFGNTVFWATIFGFFDELYQYLVLRPDGTDYFDFNDVILNQIGAGLGLVLIFSSGFYLYRLEKRKWYQSNLNIALIILIVTVSILFLTSIIEYYPSQEDHSWKLILVKVKEEGFWRFVNPVIGRFHIVRPLEGTVIIALLLMFYSTMDRVAKSITSLQDRVNG